MTIAEIKTRANEVFSSIIVFCPDFPAAAQTNTAKKFGQLIDLINEALEKLKSNDARQWTRICLQEVQEAQRHYESGDSKKGRNLTQRAEEHFLFAFSGKRTSACFIAGAPGAAADTDSGFPE